MELKELLMFMTKKGASDLHLKPMRPPLLRIQGRLIPIKSNPLQPEEVESMLGMYDIGVVRRLDFGMEWGVVIGPDGLRFMSLDDVYRAWVRFLYNVVEMENALHNDYSLKKHTLIADDSPDAYPPLKLQYLLEVHDRFMVNYVEGSLGTALEDLWAATSGICSQIQDVRQGRFRIHDVSSVVIIANSSTRASAIRAATVSMQRATSLRPVSLAWSLMPLSMAQGIRYRWATRATARSPLPIEHGSIAGHQPGGAKCLEPPVVASHRRFA